MKIDRVVRDVEFVLGTGLVIYALIHLALVGVPLVRRSPR